METLFLLTRRGLGKRVLVEDIPLTKKDAHGVRAIPLSEGDEVVGGLVVSDDDVIWMISDYGVILGVVAEEVPVQKRQARGVTVMSLDDGDQVASMTLSGPPRMPPDALRSDSGRFLVEVVSGHCPPGNQAPDMQIIA